MDTVIDRVDGTERFATAFAAAQIWIRGAMQGTWTAQLNAKFADAELQEAFELLPEWLQEKILAVHVAVGEKMPEPPRRRIGPND